MKETLAFQIAALYRDFVSYTMETLKKLDLNFGQMPLILYVGKHPGCTQAELTKALKLDWGYSQRSTVKLVESGFLSREPDKMKFGNCLQLTEKGKKAFAVCHEVFGSWDVLHQGSLTPQEKETLLILLSKMTAERKES